MDPALSRRRVDAASGELWAMMLDAKATFDEVDRRATRRTSEARERILDNRIYQQISGALAGSQEYMAMEKLYEIHERGEYDLLVLDTPPSRNALDFLDAPQRRRCSSSRAARCGCSSARPGSAPGSPGAASRSSPRSCAGVTGVDLIADLSEFFAAMSGLLGGFRERAERVEELLARRGDHLPDRHRPGRASRSRRPSTCARSSRGRPAARRA